MNELLESSKEIINRAISEYKPYAVGVMLSGGDDSMATLHVCHELGIKLDFIMHGVTGTGIKETHQFVLSVVSKEKAKYIEANAGTAYEDYVLRKGFFGVGEDAHTYSYHVLKWTHFRREASLQLRHRKRNRNILFINGGRQQESQARLSKFKNPIKKIGSNIWVNVINLWPNNAPTTYLEGNGIERNPVSRNICRSGECNCGTTLKPGDRVEIGYFYPAWRKWIDDLERRVRENGFDWGWAEAMPLGIHLERKGQLNMFTPMCSSCIVNYRKASELTPPSKDRE